jgi:cysteine-rich repeat protein
VVVTVVFMVAGISGWAMFACSGGASLSGDMTGEDAASEVYEDATVDGGEDWWPPFPDWSDIEYLDAGPVDLPYVPQCGNAVLDPGEECDDSNRVNGDGCDWRCRLGDGEPPPDPDRDAGTYETTDAGGDPIEGIATPDYLTMDLVWADTAFAVALCEDLEPSLPGEGPWAFRFARFDRTGGRVGPSWTYPAPSSSVVRLVWTGDGFGLFFVHAGAGVALLRLDPEG